MAGTREGGLKAARTLKAKDPKHFIRLGKSGGQVEVSKGFGKNKPLAKLAGQIGGSVSRPSRRHIQVQFR